MARREPIKFHGHALGYKAGHCDVRIERAAFAAEREFFASVARRCTAARLDAEFRRLPYERYKPVLRQLHSLLRMVNRLRKAAGLTLVGPECIPPKRRIYRPFERLDLGRLPPDRPGIT